MADGFDYVDLPDEALLAQCDFHVYKASGPGGQHRNKTLSAVRLRHRPTGITAHGDDSRSQHQNKRLAMTRMRKNLAVRFRREIDTASPTLPQTVKECIFIARGGVAAGNRKLNVGRKDHRFWQVAAFLLDVLEAFEGRMADSAGYIGITTGNLSAMLGLDVALLAAANDIRKRHALGKLA